MPLPGSLNGATARAVLSTKTEPKFKDYTDLFTEQEVKVALSQRPEGTARVAQHNGRATLFVNKRPVSAMLYKGVNATKSYGDYVGKFTSDTNLVDPPTSGKGWHPSWQSEVWRADLDHMFARIAEHVKTSLYIGAAQGLSDDLLNHPAREAGTYVAGPPGHQLNLSGEFASLHALRSGPYTLTLPPGRKRVLDADTGNILSRSGRAFTFSAEAQQTYWFLFE